MPMRCLLYEFMSLFLMEIQSIPLPPLIPTPFEIFLLSINVSDSSGILSQPQLLYLRCGFPLVKDRGWEYLHPNTLGWSKQMLWTVSFLFQSWMLPDVASSLGCFLSEWERWTKQRFRDVPLESMFIYNTKHQSRLQLNPQKAEQKKQTWLLSLSPCLSGRQSRICRTAHCPAKSICDKVRHIHRKSVISTL